MAKIFLSVPVLSQPELKMLYSTYQAMLSCGEHQVRIYFNENDSLISRVRNVHFSVFLDEFTDCDYFVSLDSDIEIVNAYHTNNIFTKLISHDKDFVGGLYPLKQTKTKPLCASIPLSKEITRENIPFDSGLIEMRWLSSGCWCIKRSAAEKIVKAYPELTYVGDDNVAGKPIYGVFIPALFNVEEGGRTFKKYLSEDWSFVERWRAIGGQVFADTSIVLRHIGKISHTLWDVEIVSQPQSESKTPVSTPTVLMPQPKAEANVIPPLPPLPSAGFDLKNTTSS